MRAGARWGRQHGQATFAPWKLRLGTASGTRGILQHQPVKVVFLQQERREQKERREQM